MASPHNLWPSDQRRQELLLFYHAYGHSYNSPRGSFLDILRLTDNEIERKHDYIQWLFPLAERSAHNPTVPVLDYETIMIFRRHDDDLLRENVRLGLMRMAWFYGFDAEWEDGGLTLEAIEGPVGKFRRWLRNRNHNHLRISRIIRSLRLLGMPHEAYVFYHTLLETNDIWGKPISATTLQHWKRAFEGNAFEKLDVEQRLKDDLTQEDEDILEYYLADEVAIAPREEGYQTLVCVDQGRGDFRTFYM
ncbi:opioid growth factor receptor conserved region-domain-containing protein [Hypoxylon sp. NC0597]|nr:opioid growth factor receptor conserved region-domain-containing protein [Hypoxylon sp. NC0597]